MKNADRKVQFEPARSIIDLLGGTTSAAKALGTNTTMIQRWRWAQDEGGTGGFIPRKWHGKVIAAARDKGIELPLAAFIDPTAIPAAA